MNQLLNKLKKEYVTKLDAGLYLFERGECKCLIERNDRYRAWDIYWTESEMEVNPDRFSHDEKTLRAAIIDCYRSSIMAAN